MKKFYFVFLLLLALSAFILYSWFNYFALLPMAELSGGFKIFSWPDAMANNFFVNQFIENGSFSRLVPDNIILGNIVHPRSINVIQGSMVPMGFLGFLIMLGFIGKIIGGNLVLFVVPFFAVLGALAFWGIIKQVFNEKLAFVSFILLLTLAPFWYYANLAMLPNILFLSFFLIGYYFFLKQLPDYVGFRDYLASIASGLFLSFAFIIRPVEWGWMTLLILAPLLFSKQRKPMAQIVLFFTFAVMPIVALLIYNFETYGAWLTAGYLNMQNSGSLFERLPTEFKVGERNIVLAYLQLIFLPFGFAWKTILKNVYAYLFVLVWPYALLGVTGFTLLIYEWKKSRLEKVVKFFIITSLSVGAWLVLYYGSWQFGDELTLKLNTIGSSYPRYFLPVYLLFLPFVAFLLVWLSELFTKRTYRYLSIFGIGAVIVALGLFSYNLVYNDQNDGLFKQRQVLQSYYRETQYYDRLIGSRDVLLLVDRADKVFFPKYQVISFNLDYGIFPKLKPIVGKREILYYTLLPDKDIAYINEKKIGSLDLEFVYWQDALNGNRLFKLEKKSE